jgi:hypothetical protein
MILISLTVWSSAPVGTSMEIPVNITTLDSDFPGGYQVTVADIDKDGKPDVLGLGNTVAWLANPSWKKYPVTGNQTRANIDIAPFDIDGDGKLEIVVASDFSLNDSEKGGTLNWLQRSADPEAPWVPHLIDAYPTTHRIRWADPEGTGHKVLVSAPLMGRGAKAPEYNQAAAPLFFYRIPLHLSGDPWPRQVIDDTLHMTHGLKVLDFDGDGRDEILTASFEGIHLYHASGQGADLKWTRTHLGAGEQSTGPSRGSSEVFPGKLKSGRRFLAAIEPWHGDQVVVYLEPERAGKLWQRHSIDASFSEGHALAVLDLDGDGTDEIVAGFRGRKRGVAVYRAQDADGASWERSILDDGGIACQGFFLTDLRGTGRPAIVAIGGATHNVKLYEFPSVK